MSTALYVRSRDGGTIHRMDGCVYARPPFGIPWDWAEGKTIANIKYTVTLLHLTYRWCRRCFPPEAS